MNYFLKSIYIFMKQLTIMSDFKKKKDPNMDGLKKT